MEIGQEKQGLEIFKDYISGNMAPFMNFSFSVRIYTDHPQAMSLLPFLSRSRAEADLSQLLDAAEAGRFHEILISQLSKSLLGCYVQDGISSKPQEYWSSNLEGVFRASDKPAEAEERSRRLQLLVIGLAALYAFLQANVTGPPLNWDSTDLCLGSTSKEEQVGTRRDLIAWLSVDGEAAYHLASHVELLAFAKVVLTHPFIYGQDIYSSWARLRVNFVHQQLLNETSSTLQNEIFRDIDFLDSAILATATGTEPQLKVLYLLERAAINIFHGFEQKARSDLGQASEARHFQYVLTGRLGRRTKFQQHDITQLVVLAKSAANGDHEAWRQGDSTKELVAQENMPQKLDLNDDTLLEKISFSKDTQANLPAVTEHVPDALSELDPSDQPILDPLDSIILLSTASAITNTSPQHGLTREETLPYATRALEGGSTNWQVYTQALLVRSRIEGYRSRTVERGVLQLQALVDQVIAETSGSSASPSSTDATTFLPRPKPSESALVSERLLYIFQLASPLRWTLEAELASRWVALGGLRTALEIFERLEMWAEAALCC